MLGFLVFEVSEVFTVCAAEHDVRLMDDNRAEPAIQLPMFFMKSRLFIFYSFQYLIEPGSSILYSKAVRHCLKTFSPIASLISNLNSLKNDFVAEFYRVVHRAILSNADAGADIETVAFISI